MQNKRVFNRKTYWRSRSWCGGSYTAKVWQRGRMCTANRGLNPRSPLVRNSSIHARKPSSSTFIAPAHYAHEYVVIFVVQWTATVSLTRILFGIRSAHHGACDTSSVVLVAGRICHVFQFHVLKSGWELFTICNQIAKSDCPQITLSCRI